MIKKYVSGFVILGVGIIILVGIKIQERFAQPQDNKNISVEDIFSSNNFNNKKINLQNNSSNSSNTASYNLELLEEAFIKVAESVKPAVVSLWVERIEKSDLFRFDLPEEFKFFDEFFDKYFRAPREWKERSVGSGVIVDEKGYILTNAHVIQKAQSIQVALLDGRRLKGEVIGQDKKTDLALIKVNTKDKLPTAKLGDSDNVRIGSWAIAIGNPFGFEYTVTIGVISAKGRGIKGIEAEYVNFLQTDAAINPGNSGGPLINIAGEVIGINTAIVAGGQGIGFAIPINSAKKVMHDLIKYGKVLHAWLGVYIQDITPTFAKELDLGVGPGEGVLVTSVVKNSPADKAGIQRYDVIISVDDVRVKTATELQNEIRKHSPGERVKLDIIREKNKITSWVVLGEYKAEKAEEVVEEEEKKPQKEDVLTWRGATFQDLTDKLAQHFGLPKDEEGVLVTNVEYASLASVGGLERGDVIKEVNRNKIKNCKDLKKVIKNIGKDEDAVFLIKRETLTFFITIPGQE